MMVCSVCGTRNLADESRCIRCGARLESPPPPPEPVPERELSPAERLAVEARDLLAADDTAAALRAAQRAAVMAPDTFLCRLVLGEVYLHLGAAGDALREFRRAAELDPDSAEAKEKAELARRRLTHPRETAPAGPRDWRDWLVAHKQLVAAAAGVVAALLIFTVGAAAIVSHTSPDAQIERAYRDQMALGRDHYKAGRYEDAARAFEQAARLKPASSEAQRRLQDALTIAGRAPSLSPTRPVAGGDQMASITPLNPHPLMPPRLVGPVPRDAQPARPVDNGDAVRAPIPVPPSAPSPTTDLAPIPPPVPDGPQPPAVDLTGGGNPTVPPPGSTAIGAEAPDEPPAPEPASPPANTRPRGHITIKRHEAPPPPPATHAAPPPPTADALREEADRLLRSGQAAAAHQKYGEAAVRYREEAREGGPGAAVKLGAAASCERAQQLCGTQGN